MISTLAFGAIANIPNAGSPTSSMAVIPEVSEIRAQRQADLSFDGDLKQLEAKQGRYRENLPLAKRGSRKFAPKKTASAKRFSR
jgi:hypothetical protein